MYEKLMSQVGAPESQPPPPVAKVRPRSSSAGGTKNKEKKKVSVDVENDESNLKRTMSVKYKTDKATAITKDVNLKSSNINQTKQKGGLLIKIFLTLSNYLHAYLFFVFYQIVTHYIEEAEE